MIAGQKCYRLIVVAIGVVPVKLCPIFHFQILKYTMMSQGGDHMGGFIQGGQRGLVQVVVMTMRDQNVIRLWDLFRVEYKW